jgi:hypothetical protein
MISWAQDTTPVGVLRTICTESVERIVYLTLTLSEELNNVFLYTDSEYVGVAQAQVAGEGGGGGGTLPEWIPLTAAPVSRNSRQCVEYNDKIYYWTDGSDFEDRIIVYDKILDSWSYGASAGTMRWGYVMALYDGKIYFLGGIEYDDEWNETTPDVALIYNIGTNLFSEGTGVCPSPRPIAPEAVVYGTDIFIHGGFSKDTVATPVNHIISGGGFPEGELAPYVSTPSYDIGMPAGTYFIRHVIGWDVPAVANIDGGDAGGQLISVTIWAQSPCDIKIKLFNLDPFQWDGTSATINLEHSSSVHHDGGGAQTFTLSWIISYIGWNHRHIAIYIPASNTVGGHHFGEITSCRYIATELTASGMVTWGTDQLFYPKVEVSFTSTHSVDQDAGGGWLVKYTPGTDTFAALTSAPRARSGGHDIFVYGTKLYCLNGIDSSIGVNTSTIYDFVGATWSIGNDIGRGVIEGLGVLWEGHYYMWSGLFVTDEYFYDYDIAADDLTTMDTHLAPPNYQASNIIDATGMIYSFGGYTDEVFNGDMNSIDIETVITGIGGGGGVYKDIGTYSLTPSCYLGDMAASYAIPINIKLNFPAGFLGEQVVPIYVGYGDNIEEGS